MSMIDLDKVYERTAKRLSRELYQYIGLYMVRAGKKAKRTKNPNTGQGSLRIITGNLYRSFSPKNIGAGNVFEIRREGDSLVFNYGSRVPYAAIHEYGGIAGNGAVIPARPYMRPAIQQWKRDNLGDVKSEMKQELIKEIKVWLGNQS